MSSDSSDDQYKMSDEESTGEKLCIVNPVKFFVPKELCYYKQIDKYFKECHAENPEILSLMIDIIEGRSKISLRILDWFVTKYSKKKISFGSGKGSDVFDVKISYKAQLKGYRKKYFDPFKRNEKLKFLYPCTEEGYKLENGESKHIRTTLGQLNFFRWAFTNNIISYVGNNLEQIIIEMNNYNKDEKIKKQQQKENEEKEKKNKEIEEIKTKQKKETKAITKFKIESYLTLTFD